MSHAASLEGSGRNMSGLNTFRNINLAFGISLSIPDSESIPYHWDTACGVHSHSLATSDGPPKRSIISSLVIMLSIVTMLTLKKQVFFIL